MRNFIKVFENFPLVLVPLIVVFRFSYTNITIKIEIVSELVSGI